MAVEDLRLALKQVSLTGQDLDIEASEAHNIAGLALLAAPAKGVSQVAIKIRVANNLLYLDQMHAGLSNSLIDSLFAELSEESADILVRLTDLHQSRQH